MAAILNSAILGSTHNAQNSDSNIFAQNELQTHSFSLNLKMAAILNSTMLNFDMLAISQLRHKTLTQTNLNLTQTQSF